MHGTVVESSVSADSTSNPDRPAAPIVFELEPDAGGRIVLFALLVPLFSALLIPFWLVGAQLASDPSARAVLSGRPLLGIQLLAALVMVVWIFGWPLLSFARRELERRRIVVDGGLIHYNADGPFGSVAWTEPIASYAGIVPAVKTSISDARHELVLVHPRASRCVRLPARDVSRDRIQSVARLFVLAEIPSRDAASVVHCNEYLPVPDASSGLAAA